MRKLKENRKKGFTLVELIVVLVILAILAALLVPALTGYIDKAREKQVIAETRQAVMAAQTLIDEAYAKDPDSISVAVDDIEKLADVPGDVTDPIKHEDGHLTELTYTNVLKCTYTYAPDTGKGEYSDPKKP